MIDTQFGTGSPSLDDRFRYEEQTLIQNQVSNIVKTTLNKGDFHQWTDKEGKLLFVAKKMSKDVGASYVYEYIDENIKSPSVLKIAKKTNLEGNVSFEKTCSSIQNEIQILEVINMQGKEWGLPPKPQKILNCQSINKNGHVKELIGYSTIKYDNDYFDELNENENLTVEDFLCHFQQLSFAMHTLHQKYNIVHGDIKSDNVLCKKTDDFTFLVISDFGESILCNEYIGNLRGLIGGQPGRLNAKIYSFYTDISKSIYLADSGKKEELILNEQKRDVLSLGMLFYEVITGNIAFNADKKGYAGDRYPYEDEGYDMYYPPEKERRVKNVPEDIINLIESILNPDITKRPTSMEVFFTLDTFIAGKYPKIAEKIQLHLKPISN